MLEYRIIEHRANKKDCPRAGQPSGFGVLAC